MGDGRGVVLGMVRGGRGLVGRGGRPYRTLARRRAREAEVHCRCSWGIPCRWGAFGRWGGRRTGRAIGRGRGDGGRVYGDVLGYGLIIVGGLVGALVGEARHVEETVGGRWRRVRGRGNCGG